MAVLGLVWDQATVLASVTKCAHYSVLLKGVAAPHALMRSTHLAILLGYLLQVQAVARHDRPPLSVLFVWMGRLYAIASVVNRPSALHISIVPVPLPRVPSAVLK